VEVEAEPDEQAFVCGGEPRLRAVCHGRYAVSTLSELASPLRYA
jgi:hypothetical protein